MQYVCTYVVLAIKWGIGIYVGELGCLCGKAGTSHLCDGSGHSSGCVVNGYGCYYNKS